MMQTLTQATKMYMEDECQRDWIEYTERLAYVLNTSFNRVRQNTQFFLAHGWDPRSNV